MHGANMYCSYRIDILTEKGDSSTELLIESSNIFENGSFALGRNLGPLFIITGERPTPRSETC